MNIKTTLQIFFLYCFAFIHSMEVTPRLESHVLHKVIKLIIPENDCNEVVHNIGLWAFEKNRPIVAKTVKDFFTLQQQTIDSIFLDNLKDDEIRTTFLDMGANINARRKIEGINCLYSITDTKVFIDLVNRGANVNHVDNHGNTPLGFLRLQPSMTYFFEGDSFNYKGLLERARILLEKGADINHESSKYLLHDILYSCKDQIIHLKAAQLCQQYKMDDKVLNSSVASCDQQCCTPLLLALKQTAIDFQLIELLLKMGAHADFQNQYNPLHIVLDPLPLVVGKIDPQIVSLLLLHGANPNRSYKDGKTMPLHKAIKIDIATQSGFELTKELIKYGAEIHHRDDNNKTAFDYACQAPNSQALRDIIGLLNSANYIPKRLQKKSQETTSHLSDIQKLSIQLI